MGSLDVSRGRPLTPVRDVPDHDISPGVLASLRPAR